MKTIDYHVTGKITINGNFNNKVRINTFSDDSKENSKMVKDAIYKYYQQKFRTDYIHFEIEEVTEDFVMLEVK